MSDVNREPIVVAIDGPSASGKSTVARGVARQIGYHYVDSGAMYRAVTWKAIEEGIDVRDTAAVLRMLDRIKIDFEIVEQSARMLIDGVDPGQAIREPRVEKHVSAIAAIPEVRRVLVEHQRSLTRFGDLVMEGRDIGSVVFPDTPHKFYIDADASVRASRRRKDFDAMHIETSDSGVADSIKQRDRLDSERKVAPLQVADGATVVDNSKNTIEQTIAEVVRRVEGGV
jgi:cytidylate kinase